MVVTGTEVLTGRVADRNGPWLAERLRRAGVDIAQIVLVGDRADDLNAALSYLAAQRVELIVTSGGLGPTADDLTAEVVARFCGRAMRVDEALQQRIAAIVERLTRGRGWQLDPAANAAGVRKQATVPAGAVVLEPAGTAPGLVVTPAAGSAGPPVIVLPGPPRELQAMWPAALAAAPVAGALAGGDELRQHTLRLWGTMEAELAGMLREQDGDSLAGLEITTCLSDGEVEIVTRYRPPQQAAYDGLVAAVRAAFPATLFSDGPTIDQIVADRLRSRGLTIATAESCTAGLLAGRLTNLPGSSDYVLGGLVTYSNAVKGDLAGVSAELIERVGAVSAEVAAALAAGARARLDADVGVGITGIAGPDGGTPDKPVGLVYLCASDGTRHRAQRVVIPGDRNEVRTRAVLVALHLVRDLLTD